VHQPWVSLPQRIVGRQECLGRHGTVYVSSKDGGLFHVQLLFGGVLDETRRPVPWELVPFYLSHFGLEGSAGKWSIVSDSGEPLLGKDELLPSQDRPKRSGYVYALVNEFMPGLVKIGRTSGSTEQRTTSLFTTAVPAPFEILSSIYSDDCVAAERRLHQLFTSWRVSDNREFFSVHRGLVIFAFELERDPAAAIESFVLMVEDRANEIREKIPYAKRVELVRVFSRVLGVEARFPALSDDPGHG
jgi:T5orf172 domain